MSVKQATEAEVKKALAKVNKEAEAEGRKASEPLTAKDVMESVKRGKVVTLILTDFRKFKVEV